MKKSKSLLIAMAVILTSSLFITCQKESNEPNANESEVAFTINISHTISASTMKRAMAYDLVDADRIILTVQNSDGSATKYTSSEINIQQMNGNYCTKKIVLKTGSYKLTEFLILDGNDSTIFASPLIGSQEAQNVSSPLPIAFSVTKNVTTPVSVEVLSTENKKPEDFGLNTFPIIEVKTFGFMIGVADSESSKLLATKLTVSIGTYTYVQNLDSILNNVVTVKDNLSCYTLKVEKTKYTTYTHTYSIDSMKLFKNETGNLPLLIELEKSPIPTDGLVAYYPFNGNANDESGNGNHGTNSGALQTEDRFGNIDNAYYINESNYISLNNSLQIVNKPIAISCWIKTNDDEGFIITSGVCIRSDGYSQRGWGLSVDYGGKIRFTINKANPWPLGVDNEPNPYWDDIMTSASFNDNNWHHIVGLFKGDGISRIELYVDGILQTDLIRHGIAHNYLTEYEPVFIPGINLHTNLPSGYNGNVDNLRIYDRILNNDEILVLLNEI